MTRCLAGVWSRFAYTQGILEVGDLQAAQNIFAAYSGDVVHGTAQQRLTAFCRG